MSFSIVASVTAGIGSEHFGKLSANLSNSLKAAIRESITTTSKFSKTQTKSKTETLQWKYTSEHSDSNVSRTFYITTAYNRCSYDVFLIYADYLYVTYRRKAFGQKYRKTKWPMRAPAANTMITSEINLPATAKRDLPAAFMVTTQNRIATQDTQP